MAVAQSWQTDYATLYARLSMLGFSGPSLVNLLNSVDMDYARTLSNSALVIYVNGITPTPPSAFEQQVSRIGATAGQVPALQADGTLKFVSPASSTGAVTQVSLPAGSKSPTGGVLTLTLADFGIANINNTSDLLKPLSQAVTGALSLKADLVAGKVPASQLPSGIGSAGVTSLTTSTKTSATGDITIGKGDVGLPNADNTADILKPLSAAVTGALSTKADLVSGSIPVSQLPGAVINVGVTVASQTAMLALSTATVQTGDVAVRSDGTGTFLLNASDPSSLSNWLQLLAPLDFVGVTGRDGVTITGTSEGTIRNLLRVDDYFHAPIFGIQNAGGLFVNDNIRTIWDYAGNEYFKTDIYGNLKLSGVNLTAGPGLPGNLLAFTTACFVQFQSGRAKTVADWTPTGGTLATQDSGGPSGVPASPDGFNGAMRMTSNAAGAVLAVSPSGIYGIPVVPGSLVSALASFKAVTTGKGSTVGLRFYDASLAYLGSGQDLTGSSVIPASNAWSQSLLLAATVPAGAAWAVPFVRMASTTVGEKVDVAAVGMYRNSNDTFSPPQINQPAPGASPSTFGCSKAGDSRLVTNLKQWWVCTSGGYPNSQVWAPMSGSDGSGPGAGTSNPQYQAGPLISGTLAVGTNVAPPGFLLQGIGTLSDLWAYVQTAPTGSAVVVTWKLDGVSIGTTTIGASSTVGHTVVSISHNAGQILTWDITAVGSTVAGANLGIGWTDN